MLGGQFRGMELGFGEVTIPATLHIRIPPAVHGSQNSGIFFDA